SGASLSFSSLTTMLYQQAGVDWEDDSDDLGDDGAGSSKPTRLFHRIEADLEAMRELLGGVPLFSSRNISEYSFLSGGEDEEASNPSDDSNEASTS
ncbi:hypothetical protein HAX54_012258, partial [Datura stramonium]|nr:hypothetical protein [Datura stramonium]